jgi:hypothetical protein
MVVTVTTPGWSGLGTITFGNGGGGATATLMFVQGAWYVTSMGPDNANVFPQLA